MTIEQPNAERVLNIARVWPDLREAVAKTHDTIKVLKAMDKQDEFLLKAGYTIAVRETVVVGGDAFQITTWIDYTQ